MFTHLKVTNRNFFTTTTNLAFSWHLSGDGTVAESGQLFIPELQAAEKHRVHLQSGPWSSCLKKIQGTSICLAVVVKLKTFVRWAEAGHVIASNQFMLSEGSPREPKVNASCQFQKTEFSALTLEGGKLLHRFHLLIAHLCVGKRK